MSESPRLTTASGIPVADNQNSISAGPRGPLLLQDFHLIEKLQHFNRERIPERVVHAKGSGAYGTFTVTHDIGRYTKAGLFSAVGKKTDTFVRFSTVGGERGSADTERDPRGFAIKFYTEEGIGIWLVTTRRCSSSRTPSSSPTSSTRKSAVRSRISSRAR